MIKISNTNELSCQTPICKVVKRKYGKVSNAKYLCQNKRYYSTNGTLSNFHFD